MGLLYFIVVVAAILVVAAFVMSFFTPAKRDERAVRKADRADHVRTERDLTAERERSTLAQNALREIASGAEYPIFVATDALTNINKTYSKEITK